ncbi:MAG: DUF2062 domain-containing protein [Proteobacteria bacterium]|nr:DUF2062 domain-containing protein [Pseudomonadota bacterium]
MAKDFIKRYLPTPEKVQANKYLRVFGKLIHNPNLWHLNRNSVAKAVSIGLFITYIPFPGHMILAAFMAILLRANLPISMALVWVVNPLTMIPMFGFAYTVGALLLGIGIEDLNFDSVAVIQDIWQPFLLGCLLCGAFLSIAGNALVRLLWRYSVIKNWRQRQARRRLVRLGL